MADAVLSAAVDRIFGLLLEQTEHHVNLVRGAEKEVRELGQQLNTIRNVFVDAENRSFREQNIKAWLWKLRQTSYEMEDILDEWEYALLKPQKRKHPSKQKVFSFIPSSSCLCFKKIVVHHDIANKVLNVKTRFNEILEESKSYGFRIYEQTVYPEFRPDQTTSFINIEEVHGRDREGDTLVDKLMGNGVTQEKSSIQVVSIVGVGGLGKTTLAQLVYNHSRVKESFELRIWISVSQPFDRAIIAQGILEQIKKGSSQGAVQLNDLVGRVRDSVQENKFFLVLDDVWSEDSEDWKFLKNCLELGGAGSKVLVTTRKMEVVEMMCTKESDIYKPSVLLDDDCWSILYCMSGLPDDYKAKFEDIGKKIAKRCRGLPLAAKTLGGILRFKRSLIEWENVLNDKIWEMQGVEDKLFHPLFMSYRELSPTQKQCFSYCAAFPKDFEYNFHRLIENWMALGYLGCNSDDMEQKGKECFNVLVTRSLFQNIKKRRTGEILSCKMHDIVHDFAKHLRMSGMKEAAVEMDNVNEFGTLYWDKESTPNLCNYVYLRVLSLVRCGLQGVPLGIDKLIHLRWLNLSENRLSIEYLKFICQLYFLQTLILRDCSLVEIPNEIENLSQLRHLNLCCNKFKKLPNEIGNLKQLRSLKLDYNYDLKALPREIEKLSFLLALLAIKCGSEGNNLGLLKNLNQLNSLAMSIRLDVKDLKGMVEDAREANMSNKKHLEHLTLLFMDGMGEEEEEEDESSRIARMGEEEESSRIDVLDALKPHQDLKLLGIEGYKGSKLPLWIVSPANQLRRVRFSYCDLTSLPSLGRLQCLEEIYIQENRELEFVGREFLGITTNNNLVVFPKLKILEFYACLKWEEWEDITAEEEESPDFQVMPFLVELKITYCDALTALPHRLLRKASSILQKEFSIEGSQKLEQRYRGKEYPYWKT